MSSRFLNEQTHMKQMGKYEVKIRYANVSP